MPKRADAAIEAEPPVIIGQSELADFRQCPLKHQFRWRMGWYQPDTGPSDPRNKSAIGTQFHAILAKHYGLLRELQRAGREIDGDFIGREVGKFIGALGEMLGLDEERMSLLQWMYEGYIERWGFDRDWEIVAIEQTLITPIFDPDTGERTRFQLRWTADLVVRVISLDRRIAIIDNKTVEGAGTWGQADVDLHDQIGLYLRGWSHKYSADPALFGMLNQVRRDRLKRPMTLTERFSRPRGTRTRLELDEIERDFLGDARRMYGEENLRRPTSHPDPKQCGWKCDFKEPHIVLRRSGGDMAQALRVIQARGMSNDPAGDPALARHV